MEQAFKAETDGFNLFNLSINEHTGPHIDAPLHLSADGRSVDEIPIGNLVVPLCVVDIREKAAANPDARLTPDDLTAWIEANDDIADRTCVAMMSGWGEEGGATRLSRRGCGRRDALPRLSSRSGRDAVSGPRASTDFAAHYAWLPAGRYGIENIAGLEQMPAAGATLFVGAPKHAGGSGGPGAHLRNGMMRVLRACALTLLVGLPTPGDTQTSLSCATGRSQAALDFCARAGREISGGELNALWGIVKPAADRRAGRGRSCSTDSGPGCGPGIASAGWNGTNSTGARSRSWLTGSAWTA